MSQIIGAITTSGFALASTTALVVGLRGSDRINLKRDSAGGLAFVTGSLWLAAGTTWANMANQVHDLPTSAFGQGGLGDPGPGGAALVLGILTFCPKWKKLIIPSFLGISLAVAAQLAGGLGGVAVNSIIMISGKLG